MINKTIRSLKNSVLLNREQFRELSHKRDCHQCIFCSDKNTTTHHILDRSLFSDGGYYLNNAACVCQQHHWQCEKTDISVEEVRKACGITDIVVPDGFSKTIIYDKWCNIILPNSRRLPGPLFFQDNVQKILKDKLWLFDF